MIEKAKSHLIAKDEILKNILVRIDLPVVENTKNVFHDLMSCVIEQQIHYRSSKKIFEKMLEVSSLKLLTLQNFSTFEKSGFKNVKLSTRKYETIAQTLDFFSAQNIDWQNLEDNEVRKQLSKIKGIGTWTIDMILLFTLDRPNIFPADDYHLKQIMFKLYDIDTTSKVKSQLKAIAANWSPYQSIAVKYLLAWKTAQQKKLI